MPLVRPAAGASELRLEHCASIDAIEDAWRLLGERSDNVFATWEWLSTWWRYFGRDRELCLTLSRGADGAPLAILPWYVSTRRPLRVMRWLGHSVSDELGPICDPADRNLAAIALRDRLGDTDLPWDLVIADEMNGAFDWKSVIGGRRLARTPTPVVRFGGTDWDAYLATRSKNLRGQLHRKARRLEELGRVTYRFTDDPDRLDDDLAALIALHDARWEERGGSRAFMRREEFHREFAAQALSRGWLRLWFLELDGRPVAALYNLRFGRAESMYQGGRDPALAPYSVGLLLHARAMQCAIADGLDEYRFLRGDEAYKSRFTTDDPQLETVAFARGPAAHALRRAITPVPRLPRPLRRRVPAAISWGTGVAPMWGPT